jgi:splicing factor U2AF subunit
MAVTGADGMPYVPNPNAGSSHPASFGATPVRQSKRLYVGNVTEAIQEQPLLEFFNGKMHENKFAADMPGDPVASVQVNVEKGYAFVEVCGQ